MLRAIALILFIGFILIEIDIARDVTDNDLNISNIVVIYAMPTFHEEVVSSVACLCHSLGFYVVVYIGNGINIGPITLPFTGSRKRRSSAFYGSCVSKWITIKQGMKLIRDPSLMVFVTYPMWQGLGHEDPYAIQLLENIRDSRAHTSVAYIVHRTDEINPPLMAKYETYVHRSRSTYLFLSEHTLHDAQQRLSSLSNIYSFDVFYPVIPESIFLDQQSTNQNSESFFRNPSSKPIFVLQGII
jgi:hypothetical protein